MNKSVLIGLVIVIAIVAVAALLINRSRDIAPAPIPTDDMSAFDDLDLLAPLATPSVSPTATPGATISPSVSGSPLSSSPSISPSAGTIKNFTMTGANFRFSLSEMRVKQGDTVRLTLTNNDTMPHDWKIDALNVSTEMVQPGGQDTIEFVANQKGSFEYYCSVGTHRQMGMKGTLFVE